MKIHTWPDMQTFIFENTEFMIGILHTEKTSDSMSKSLDSFQEIYLIKSMNNYFQCY